MSGPDEQLARSRLRASHADRERVIGLLKVAYVQGRLSKDEFDARVDQGFAARTYAELSTLTDDLPVTPVVPTAARPVRPRPAGERARPLADADVRTGGKVIARAAVITVLLWAAAIATFSPPLFIAALGATGTAIVAAAMTGSRLLGLWIDQFRDPRPPRPAIGDEVMWR